MLKPQKKVKISKKEIKEDKFVEAALNAKAYVEENYQKVTIITAVIFGIVILFMGYRYVHNQNVERSSAILGEAQLEYHNLNYPKAKEFISRLMDEYSGTDAAEQGQFLLANLLFQEKDYEGAKTNFKEFIDTYDGSDILVASGYAGYAACLETEDQFTEAGKYYEMAQKKDPGFVEAANYLYLAALNFERAGDNAKAQKLFEKIVEDYDSSNRKDDAKTQLVLLANK